jgi:hypothetical protein
MSMSAKIYSGAALVLVAFPLLVGLWGGSSSAIIAIMLIGVGGYGFAVCLLLASFWHRYRYGTWPVVIAAGPSDTLETEPGAGGREPGGARYRTSHALQGWLKRLSSSG